MHRTRAFSPVSPRNHVPSSNHGVNSLDVQVRPRWVGTRTCFAVVMACCGTLLASNVSAEDWFQWRGPDQNGALSIDGNANERYPIQWNEQNQVRWKIAIPGNGGSTPVVSGKTTYLTSGVDGKNTLLAISVDDGSTRWSVAIGKDRGKRHRKGGGSNPSAVAKDGLVYAYFRSGDLGCVDVNGSLKWSTNLQQTHGPDELGWDLSTSPLVTDDAVVVAAMHSGPSYVVAIDRRTGQELWKVDRNVDAPGESADSYTTPLLVSVNGRQAVAVLGADHLTVHDLADGTILGKLGGFNPSQQTNIRSIASPVASGRTIVCPYMRGETMTAVDLSKLISGRTETAILWTRDDVGSDVPTPVLVGDQVIFLRGRETNRGTVTSLDLETGKTRWSLRIKGGRNLEYSSSPLVAGDHLYALSESGATYVIGPLSSDNPRVISSNLLDDDQPYTTASPVPLGDSLLIRTRGHLYKIGA